MIIPPADLDPPPWPEWVLEHWVWEPELFTADGAIGLVREYFQRDIPVGATMLDSRWETGYNTSAFNLERHPDPQALVDALQAMGVEETSTARRSGTGVLRPSRPHASIALPGSPAGAPPWSSPAPFAMVSATPSQEA